MLQIIASGSKLVQEALNNCKWLKIAIARGSELAHEATNNFKRLAISAEGFQ